MPFYQQLLRNLVNALQKKACRIAGRLIRWHNDHHKLTRMHIVQHHQQLLTSLYCACCVWQKNNDDEEEEEVYNNVRLRDVKKFISNFYDL